MKSLFDAPELRSKSADTEILKKAKKKSTPTTKKSGGGISTRIERIIHEVETKLAQYFDETLVIRDEQVLADYIDKCISEGVAGIDTETTGLDPKLDELVGIGIYTYSGKSAYIPLNHKSYITGAKSKGQLPVEVVAEQIQRLEDAHIFIVMFNAPFDIRTILNGTGVRLHCDWDTYLGARCLNENEPVNKLKPLHQKYVLKGEGDAFTFDDLFKGITFDYVPIETGAVYAAHDPKITVELCDYQKRFLYYEPDCDLSDRNGMNGASWVFLNIEMPVVDAVVDMEENGIAFDTEYNLQLQEKYHKIQDEKLAKFHSMCDMYADEIANYNGKVKFDTPINIGSVPQLQALLYDILGLKGIDPKTKKPTRSTGAEVLQKLHHPMADAILDYRNFATIVSTFIDKMPNCVNPNDGRVHCKFNQYGADTGRFSSSDPNMQNIPSHNKDIRKMFKATDGYVIMSADYSQQEVKGMAQMCHDEGMIQAFREGKDFYAAIASVAFNYPYEDCLEFQVDENGEYILDKNGERITNPEGKERRASAKSILLGINYGRGASSIAEQLGCKKEDAERIKEDVFKGFPAIEKFEKQSIQMAEDLGYVTTLWGRKRRLPNMQLPDYEFQYIPGATDDILDFESFAEDVDVPDKIVNKYLRKLHRAWGDKKRQVIEEAKQEGIMIIDNTKRIADATRQVVNSRIQGSAADMTKLAMVALQKDERLKELGFRMLIPIHDELLVECPIENAKECAERFARIMSEAPGDRFEIPISCDVTISDRWYGDSVSV